LAIGSWQLAVGQKNNRTIEQLNNWTVPLDKKLWDEEGHEKRR
jgi:hypothetical protein